MPAMRKLYVDAKFLVNKLEYEIEVQQEITGLPNFEPLPVFPDEDMEVEEEGSDDVIESADTTEHAVDADDSEVAANSEVTPENDTNTQVDANETESSDDSVTAGQDDGNLTEETTNNDESVDNDASVEVLKAGPRMATLYSLRKGPEIPEYRKELTGMADGDFYNFMLAWFEVMMRLGIDRQTSDETMNMLDIQDFTDIFQHFFGEVFDLIEQEEEQLNQEKTNN
jgi:hypothetical protein